MQSIPKSIVGGYPFHFLLYENRDVKDPRYFKENNKRGEQNLGVKTS